MSRKTCDKPDYYRILGVPDNASSAEITAAFYALARRHHPDTAMHDDPSNMEFKAIAEAYEVLTDPNRRREYDRQRGRSIRVTVRDGSADQPRSQSSVDARRPTSSTTSFGDIYAELPVTPEEARYGGPCQLRVTRLVRCPACGGAATAAQPCLVCQSSGRQLRRESLVIQIPPRVRSGSVLSLAGYGHVPPEPVTPRTDRPGRLLLQIVIRPCW